MPLRGRARATAAKLSSKQRSELQHPASDRLVGDIQPTLGEQILDITEAEGEANIEPNGVPNDRREIGDERTRWLSFAIIIEPQPSAPAFA